MRLQEAKIIKNLQINSNTFLLEFPYKYNIFPSQFVMIDTYPYRLLLKPFSIAGHKDGVVQIIYRVISDGTKYLSTQKEKIRFLGPFGNIKKAKQVLKQIKNKKVYLIAGGSGVASLIFFYNYIKKQTKDLLLIYGEKEKSSVVNLKKFGIETSIYTTEDGSYGEKGTVVDVFLKYLKNNSIDCVICCGPKPMLKKLQELLSDKNVLSFALLEEYMCCGVGVCRSCVVKIKNKNDFTYQTVCKDGPIFNFNEIII